MVLVVYHSSKPKSIIKLCFGILNHSFHTSYTKSAAQFGLNKVERRNLKRRLNLANETAVKKKHIFKEICPIDNKYDLAKFLHSSEIFKDEGLIAVNKPYGISRYENNDDLSGIKNNNIIQTLNSSGCSQVSVSIEAALPLLCDLFKVTNLKILHCPERWSSGVILMAGTEKTITSVKKSFLKSLSKQIPHKTYWTITNGISDPVATREKVANYLKYVEGVQQVPIIKKKYSKADITKGLAKPNVVEHKVLAFHDDTDSSLVEINVLNTKWHFLRVWMAHCCSPILGDLLYSGRVKKVMGKKVLVSPHQVNAYKPPDLSPALLQRLQLTPGLTEVIPCHIHLSKLKLDTYLSKKYDLEITAPPPEYFSWTCKQLELMDDTGGLLNAVDNCTDDLLLDEEFESLLVKEEDT